MSGYIGTQPVPQATQTRQTFVATAAQTSFATGGYSVGYLDVFLNGVKLQDGVDYTATNGSDIVLTVGAALDDTLEVVAYTAFEVLDQTFTGTTTVTDSGAAPLVANRTTSDGTILDLRKDNATVGSISTNGVGSLSFNANGGFLSLGSEGSNYVELLNSRASAQPRMRPSADNTVNLGDGGRRFKDLYLSGGVFLGGVGSANKLDDYEEGTWTPRLEGSTTGTATYVNQTGYYTKIGNRVFIQGRVRISSFGTIAGTLAIEDLPFTNSSAADSFSPIHVGTAAGLAITAGYSLTGYTNTNSTQFNIRIWDLTTGTSTITSPEFSADGDIIFSGSYPVA